jgi:hypothetical protein
VTTLSNSFHETSYRTRYTREELHRIDDRIQAGHADEAEKALLRRIRRALCGIAGCTCGDGLGERPSRRDS